jgi:hypothetical protein
VNDSGSAGGKKAAGGPGSKRLRPLRILPCAGSWRAVPDSQLAPNRCAWQMRPDRSYQRTSDSGDCQQAMIDLINQRS